MYYSTRIILVSIGLYLSYIFVKDLIKPKILDKYCLTNTQNCSTLEIYRYKNTFLAKEEVSQVWFWYNGVKLYVFGLASGKCEDGGEYVPVNAFTIFKDSSGVVNFSGLPNECIIKLETVKNYYKDTLKIDSENIFLYREDTNQPNNIFNIIKNMLDNKIFIL